MPTAKIRAAEVPVGALVPNRDNPKGRAADPGSLVSSLRDVGMIHPIPVVAAGAKYELLAGHRRLAAAKALGWKKVPVVVHPPLGGKSEALLRMLAENEVRQDLEPLEGAQLVQKLLGEVEGGTHERVAKVLGRSVKWVARRANLLSLCPEARKAAEKGVLKKWPPLWLEELALLDPSAQRSLLKRGPLRFVESYGDLTRFLGEQLKALRHAPWELDDATLLKRAGACSTCPKTSCARPGLFNGFSDPSDLSKALCTDVTCWSAKHGAWLSSRVTQVRMKHRDQEVELLHGSPDGLPTRARSEAFRTSRLQGQPVQRHAWHPKSKKKGGKPGVVVTGKRTGDLVYFARGAGRTAPRSGAEPKRKSVAEKRMALKHKRARHVITKLWHHAQKPLDLATALDRLAERRGITTHPNQDHLLLELLAAVGTGDIAADLKLKAFPTDALRSELWGVVQEQISVAIGLVSSNAQNWKTGSAQLKDLQHLADLLGFNVETALSEAAEELPEPRSWKDQAKQSKPAKRNAKSKARRA